MGGPAEMQCYSFLTSSLTRADKLSLLQDKVARGKWHQQGLGTFLPCHTGTSQCDPKQSDPHTSGGG